MKKIKSYKILPFYCIVLLTLSISFISCGTPDSDDNEPVLRSKPTDPKTYHFGKIRFESQFEIKTVPGSYEKLIYLNEKDRKYNVEFKFEPQIAGSDNVGKGIISVSIGSNKGGNARANSQEVFNEDQNEIARRLGPSFYKPQLISSADVEVNNLVVVRAQYIIKWKYLFEGEKERFVICLYHRLSKYRSLIVRVVSDYDFDTLWPEQIDAIENLLGSFH